MCDIRVREPNFTGDGEYCRVIENTITSAGRTLLEARGKTVGRYLVVSVINTVNHQVLLWLANSIWGWPGGWANVFAAVVASVPGYLLSRAWVWERSGKHDFRSEVLPFWLIALAGLVVSTGFAEAADRWVGAGLWVNVASLAGYFIVWLVKFVLLDRLFGPRDDADLVSSS